MPRLLLRLEEKYKELFTSDQQATLERKANEVKEYCDKNAALPLDLAQVPAFMATRILFLDSEVQYLETYRKALKDLYDNDRLSWEDYEDEHDRFMDVEGPARCEALALKAEPRVIAQIMRERMENGYLIFEAYTQTLRERKTATSGNLLSLEDIHNCFKKGVLDYYKADGSTILSRVGQVWCHAFGWQPHGIVEVAHIVPKTLDGEFLGHIFGVKVNLSVDYENTLLLHPAFHSKIQSGELVIVPAKGHDNRWEIIIVDESIDPETDIGHYTWKEMNHKLLQFSSRSRPGRRYLYLRFFMTYLKQKWLGNTSFTNAVETREIAWPSPARYLRDSFVRTVTQFGFGADLSNVFQGTFMDGDGEKNSRKLRYANERAAVWMMEVVRSLAEK